MSLVKNVTGSSRWPRPSTGESSWLEYWENQVGHSASHCGQCGDANHDDLVGAHVQKVFGGNEMYITPLCRSCNQLTESFWVDTELVRVPSGL